MSKAVLFSIKPKYCELISSGKKTVEVRKTKPKLDTPFKCYIYCTKDKKNIFFPPLKKPSFKPSEYVDDIRGNGKVIGEFVCDEIIEILPDNEIYGIYDISDDEVIASCLVNGDLWNYGKGKTLYGFHISDLVIYDKPKELCSFEKACNHDCAYCKFYYGGGMYEPPSCEWEDFELTRPPQSWCYVEELI